LRRYQPIIADAVLPSRSHYFRVFRVQDNITLRCHQVRFWCLGYFLDTVGVVKENSDVADSTHTRVETRRYLSCLNARVAEDALLRFAGLPIIVCLFIGTAADTETPAAAFILTHQNHSILASLIDGTTGTSSETGRVQTMVTDTREVEKNHLLKAEESLPFRLSQFAEVNIIPSVYRRATEVIIPVRTSLDI
jgi:hypothetical protein